MKGVWYFCGVVLGTVFGCGSSGVSQDGPATNGALMGSRGETRPRTDGSVLREPEGYVVPDAGETRPCTDGAVLRPGEGDDPAVSTASCPPK
jgi:hypothetical protein